MSDQKKLPSQPQPAPPKSVPSREQPRPAPSTIPPARINPPEAWPVPPGVKERNPGK